MPPIRGFQSNPPMKGRTMNKTMLNLTFAVMLGVIGTEVLMKKTPLGKMLGI